MLSSKSMQTHKPDWRLWWSHSFIVLRGLGQYGLWIHPDVPFSSRYFKIFGKLFQQIYNLFRPESRVNIPVTFNKYTILYRCPNHLICLLSSGRSSSSSHSSFWISKLYFLSLRRSYSLSVTPTITNPGQRHLVGNRWTSEVRALSLDLDISVRQNIWTKSRCHEGNNRQFPILEQLYVSLFLSPVIVNIL